MLLVAHEVSPMIRHVGLDFGTTNSSLAIAAADGSFAVTTFQLEADAVTESFRSVVYFDPPRKVSRR